MTAANANMFQSEGACETCGQELAFHGPLCPTPGPGAAEHEHRPLFVGLIHKENVSYDIKLRVYACSGCPWRDFQFQFGPA